MPTGKRKRAPLPASLKSRSVSAKPSLSAIRFAALGVLLLLAVALDDRHVGAIADGRQMIRTAVALAYTGQIGQASGFDFTLPRAAGDAVSRFGMGMSLAQLPAAWGAGWVEAKLGAGASQSLFLLIPWLCVGFAGYLAGRVAQVLGVSSWDATGVVVAATLASPLAAYAALEFSEPLQAVLLLLVLLLSLQEAERGSVGRRSVAAGLALGAAVLTKSSLVVVAPWLLVPLLEPGDRRKSLGRFALVGAGAAMPLGFWAFWELDRFGRLFGGYGDDRFTHPIFEGCWRLLVGWNRGLFWFFPAGILALGVLWSFLGRASLRVPRSRAALGVLGAVLTSLLVAASYWGWHGMEGWGPRLVVAVVPLFAPWAFLLPQALPLRGWALSCVLIWGIGANLPPWWIHPTPVASYVMNVRWPELSLVEAQKLPEYARQPSQLSGNERVVPFEVLEKLPSANPWRTYLWLGRLARGEDSQLAEGLMRPPWYRQRPDLVPEQAWSQEVARLVVTRPRFGFLGRSLFEPGVAGRTFLEALSNQLIRASELGEFPLAWKLLRLRERISRDAEANLWHLELLRRERRWHEFEMFLKELPPGLEREPTLHLVVALAERDLGRKEEAQARFADAARALPGTVAAQLASRAPEEWPATLAPLLQTPRRDAIPE